MDVMDIFNPFKKPDPKEMVRKWQTQLRTNTRQIDRQIRDIKYEEKKVTKAIQEAAKRQDLGTCKVLAKEIAYSRKTVGRLYTTKAQMLSLSTSLSEQVAMVRVTGTLEKSTEVMKVVSDMIKIPEIQRIMVDMGKEMMHAGLLDEMMGEALDDALDDENLEEETDAEVERVLMEVAGETLASLPGAKFGKIAAQQQEQQQVEVGEEEERMRARLDAVRS